MSSTPAEPLRTGTQSSTVFSSVTSRQHDWILFFPNYFLVSDDLPLLSSVTSLESAVMKLCPGLQKVLLQREGKRERERWGERVEGRESESEHLFLLKRTPLLKISTISPCCDLGVYQSDVYSETAASTVF